MSECRRCLIEGRVQGVFFRASTRAQALRLSITGWAKNLVDGRVEVVMFGEPQHLEQLQQWLQHGPPLARITHVACEPCSMGPFDGFSTH